MTPMTDISIDLETLSTLPNAAILSIGAVEFNRYNGTLGRRMYAEIELNSAIKHGHVDGGTLVWWMGRGDKAKRVFGGDEYTKMSLATALDLLTEFYRQSEADKVWGNGSSFDITILESAYTACGFKAPWQFWNVRDMRTIVDLAAELGFDKSSVPFEGTAHHAGDDAAHQAKVIAKCWQTAKVGGAPREEMVLVDIPRERRTEWVPASTLSEAG